MTKTTLALAAALLAGTTLTSAANAGGVRVGFGFPLGSFIAQRTRVIQVKAMAAAETAISRATQSRRQYQAAAPPARKIKHAPKANVADKVSKPDVQTAKLEDKLITNDETTTEIAKTPAADVSGTQSTASTSTTTTAVLDKEINKAATTTTPATAKVEAPKVEKVATVEKTETSGKAEQKTISVPAAKRVCRRFSAAIAGLVDVPCQ